MCLLSLRPDSLIGNIRFPGFNLIVYKMSASSLIVPNAAGFLQLLQRYRMTFYMVRTRHGKNGKSWNFSISKSRPGNIENFSHGSHGKLKFYLHKIFTCFIFLSHIKNMNYSTVSILRGNREW